MQATRENVGVMKLWAVVELLLVLYETSLDTKTDMLLKNTAVSFTYITQVRGA